MEFLAGLSTGFVVGLLTVAWLSKEIDKSAAKSGLMKVGNDIYKLTRIDP